MELELSLATGVDDSTDDFETTSVDELAKLAG